MTVTDGTPLTGRLLEIVGRLGNTLRVAERVRLAQEASEIVGQLMSLEEGHSILESTLKQEQAARVRADKLADAQRHRAELLLHGLTESIAHLDASSARIREARARVSGHRYEPPPYRD